MGQLESGWTDFHEIWYWEVLLKSVDTFQFWLKSDNNNVHFTWRPTCVSKRRGISKLHWLPWSRSEVKLWQTSQNRYAMRACSVKFGYAICHHNTTQKKCSPCQRDVWDWLIGMLQADEQKRRLDMSQSRVHVFPHERECGLLWLNVFKAVLPNKLTNHQPKS
jgi:hypothetical protein